MVFQFQNFLLILIDDLEGLVDNLRENAKRCSHPPIKWHTYSDRADFVRALKDPPSREGQYRVDAVERRWGP